MTAKRYKVKLGRPLKFNNPSELEDLIDTYFKKCQHDRIVPGKIGLINYLGISKKTFYNYLEEDHQYSDVMDRALITIEAFSEALLYTDKFKGAKFNLEQQFGWNEGSKNHNINENISVPYEEYLKGIISNEEY